MDEPAIIITGLSKVYALGPHGAHTGFWRRATRDAFDRLRGKAPERPEKTIWALRDINISVDHGERLGIIGRNGAGKSTLLKILSRVVYPTAGEVRIRGRLTSLLEVGTGFNDNLSGRENVFLNAALYGLTRQEIEERFDDIIAFSEVSRFVDTPVKNYSSGMKMRLAFAIAAHLDPDILLLDEVLAVGDAAFQQKCLSRVHEISSHQRTLVFVSHSSAAIRQFCNRCIWLRDGEVFMDGPADDVVGSYSESVLGGKSGAVFLQKPREPSTSPQEHWLTPDDLESWAALHSVQALNDRNERHNSFTADESIILEVEYEVFRDKPVFPAFRLYQDNVLITTIAYWQDDYPVATGVYRSQTIIPPFLLNVGEIEISVVLNTPISSRLHKHSAAENALRLFIHETTAKPSPVGPYRKLPGAVRPFFKWETVKINPTIIKRTENV